MKSEKLRKKSRLYFVIAAVLIEALALLWSVDLSFIYILLGGAVIFVFLGFWSRPSASERKTADSYSSGPKSGKHRPGEEVSYSLRSLFPKHFFLRSGRPSTLGHKVRSFVMGITFFVVTISFVVLISTFLGEGETYSYEAVDFFNKAENFRWNGELDSADHYYRRALAEKRDYPEALIGYSYDWMARERYDSAISIFNRVLDIDPDYEDGRYGKALAYHYQKKYNESLKESLKILKDFPESARGVILTGDNYYMQQRYDSAIYWYDAGYEMGARDAWLCHVMAYIYDTKGDHEKARQLYEETLGYDSTRTDVYRRLGELLPGGEGEYYRNMARQLKEQGY